MWQDKVALITRIDSVQRIEDGQWAYRILYNNGKTVDTPAAPNVTDANRNVAIYLRVYVKTTSGMGVSPNSPVFFNLRGVREFIQSLERELEKDLLHLTSNQNL